MASSKLLLSLLRCGSRPISSLSTLPYSYVGRLFTDPNSLRSQPPIPSHNSLCPSFFNSLSVFHFINGSSFSTCSGDDSECLFVSGIESNPTNFRDEVLQSAVNGSSGSGEELFLPVRSFISLLDGFHDLTGLPWWAVIASTTIAMRVTLFPLLVLQLNKLKKISELFPKLPVPSPQSLSGRSFMDQLLIFRRERKAMGCPSFLWFLAYFSVQEPCFLLWMISIRRMSLDHHPGFDCGGSMWFQNLTEFPHGVLGSIFPLLIACLHYTNIQLAFNKSTVQKTNGLLALLFKYYKFYLDILTVPLIFIGYCIPQGSLVYWVTNSSLSVIQQLCLKHPVIRGKLGFPLNESSTSAAVSVDTNMPETPTLDCPPKGLDNSSPEELLALSVQLISSGQRESAIPVLRLALQKDPNYVEALVVMGQTLLQKRMYAEATEYLELAISKGGRSTKVKNVDLLMIASQGAGIACMQQGKNVEGIMHLERVATLEEPEDPKSKVYYFDSLVCLASALYSEGHKTEAFKYLRAAVAYNPAFNELLEQYEKNENEFGSDLVDSRRKDY